MVKIEIENVSYQYPQSDQLTLHDVSMTLSGNERIALIGQNGAGKTTLTKQLNGILHPTSGHITIDGIDVNEQMTAEWASKVGYVFQNPNDQLFLDAVKKELAFGPQNIGMTRGEIQCQIRDVSQLVGLQDRLSSHPLDLIDADKKFCAIGSVLTMNPDVVVMDEPTGGQDEPGRKRLAEILAWLKLQHKLCLVVSHDMRFVAENFDCVIVMEQGQIVLDGTARDVFSHPEVLAKAFVTPPPVTRLAQQLGWSKTVLTVKEFVEELKQQV